MKKLIHESIPIDDSHKKYKTTLIDDLNFQIFLLVFLFCFSRSRKRAFY